MREMPKRDGIVLGYHEKQPLFPSKRFAMPPKQDWSRLFANVNDPEKRQQLLDKPAPQVKYIMAFTPRSGSSYLCDVMKRNKVFGRPDEYLSLNFAPDLLRHAPGKSGEEYLDLILRHTTQWGAAGLKASWFHFRDFLPQLAPDRNFSDFKFIYLTRRSLADQAVSLYRATETNVFHTNIKHGEEKLDALKKLRYDYDKIDRWFQHIDTQERGWQHFFNKHNIFPLTLTYEEIEADVARVAKRAATFLALPHLDRLKQVSTESVFTKLAERRSLKWACKYLLEKDEKVRAAKGEAAGAPAPQAGAGTATPPGQA